MNSHHVMSKKEGPEQYVLGVDSNGYPSACIPGLGSHSIGF